MGWILGIVCTHTHLTSGCVRLLKLLDVAVSTGVGKRTLSSSRYPASPRPSARERAGVDVDGEGEDMYWGAN